MPTFKISETTRRELEEFKVYARKQEYTEATTIGYCTYLSRFLRRVGLQLAKTLKDTLEAFLATEQAECPKTYKYCRSALRLYYKMVTGANLKHKPQITPSAEITALLKRFCDYSLDVKYLREGTVASEINHVQRFLEFSFERNQQEPSQELTAEDVRCYVVERLAGLLNSSKGRYITSIRNFFRCQSFYGEPVHPSIFKLPLSPAVWKKSAFPTTVDVDIFNLLHEIPDEDTAIGKRNRCIILCFTELALRCSEVAMLTLDDFNWHGKYVTVRNTKNGSERALPLSETLFSALTGYLTQARPQTKCRTLFVRFAHLSGDPMGGSQIRGVIRRNGAKAGLTDCESNTHILRRTAATKLYNSGNSLKLTADILGHECLDSTTHYAKTDTARLLSVASPWPGGDCND